MPVLFIASIFIVCSLLLSGPDAVAIWTLAVLVIGFRSGSKAAKRKQEGR